MFVRVDSIREKFQRKFHALKSGCYCWKNAALSIEYSDIPEKVSGKMRQRILHIKRFSILLVTSINF